MILQRGHRFAVAEYFHLSANWAERLQIGSSFTESNGAFFPGKSWRTPTDDEVSVLTEATEATPGFFPGDPLQLFHLPGHIQGEWWSLLEKAQGILGKEPLPGFDGLMQKINEFLAFKNLPLPGEARCDVLIRGPGGENPSPSEQGFTSRGLRSNLAPWVPLSELPGSSCARLWGVINMGDEWTSLVLINLPFHQMMKMLADKFTGEAKPGTAGELTSRFLRLCGNYPPVRLVLHPGEGIRLSEGGIILDSYLEGKQDPDVLLMVTQEDRPGESAEQTQTA